MAYTDDAVLAKLSALNESHDSIATAAQWIMFHRRHADKTVQLWLQRLKDSPSPKRLNLIYLANEVTQQSKARHKDDFVLAFSPVIAEATATAYKGAPSDVQNKLRRVVDVWRDRAIFEGPIQAAVEARIDELDKARGAPKSGFGGPSIFGPNASTTPSELMPLVAPQQNVSKLLLSTKAETSKALQEFERLTNPANPIPSAPVYAARLNGLLKTLADAEGAVQQCVKARTGLIEALERMLDANRNALAVDQATLDDLHTRRGVIDTKKQDVEHAILSGLNAGDHGGAHGQGGMLPEIDRPEVEALTPPSVPDDEPDLTTTDAAPAPPQPYAASTTPAAPTASPLPPDSAAYHSPAVPQPSTFLPPTSAPGIEMLSALASQYQAVPVSTNGANKRRRIDTADDVPDLDDGIEPDVAEMLRNDSAGA